MDDSARFAVEVMTENVGAILLVNPETEGMTFMEERLAKAAMDSFRVSYTIDPLLRTVLKVKFMHVISVTVH